MFPNSIYCDFLFVRVHDDNDKDIHAMDWQNFHLFRQLNNECLDDRNAFRIAFSLIE